MKTQLPSTLTQKKAWMIFFLTLLIIKGNDAGQAFRNCLENKAKDTTSYNFLLKFPFNTNTLISDNSQLELCCNKTKCIECLLSDSDFYCRKIFDNIFCGQYPSNCIGFIGNSSITENKSTYGVTCQTVPELRDKFELAQNLINIGPITGLDLGYGFYDCSASDYCLKAFCGWDNGGWACSYFGSGTKYCHMQWPASWPGPVDFNPFPINTSTTTTIKTTSTVILTPPTAPVKPEPSGNNHLVEKIIIPVGTLTGVSITSFLTYYFCKKKKREKQLLVNNANNQSSIQSGQQNFDNLSTQQPSEMTDFSNQMTVNNLSNLVINDNHSPSLGSPSSLLGVKERLTKRLIGKEQLWNNYLDVNNLLITNPQSQVALKEYYQIQNELLQTFTINDLNLLLENEYNKQRRSPQSEYFEIKEEPRSTQGRIGSLTPITEINYHNPQTNYFEIRNPQGTYYNYNYL